MGELAPNRKQPELNNWSQAQTAVIGAMMIDERCLGEVFQATTPEMFSDGSLRHIYEAARRLWLEHRPVDPVTVCDACGGNGNAYAALIAEAMRVTPTVANVMEYAEVLRRCLRLSTYRAAAYELLDAATTEMADEVWQRLGRELMGAEKMRCVSLREMIGQYLDRMNDATPPEFINFGIEQLDKKLLLRRGKFCILGADSSAGKTALALQFAYHAAECGYKVGFFSLETDNDTLVDRLMAEDQAAGVPLKNSRLHALRRIDYDRVLSAGNSVAARNLYLTDTCETLDQIRTTTVQMGFDLVVIDYLQLIDAPGDKRWDIVTDISMTLHRMARRLNVTVLGLSQITPKGKDTPLTMDDLRESRQLKHDADVILLLELCRDFPNGRSLTIAKNKDGLRNSGMKLDFDPEHMTFRYHTRVQTSEPSPTTELQELDDDEGGDLPF